MLCNLLFDSSRLALQRRVRRVALFVLLCAFPLAAPAQGQEDKAKAAESLVLPLASAQDGKETFVVKGCVICHSVNDVGGKAAPALDAKPGSSVDPLGFVARMWRGAPAMLELQAIELGYQIELSAQEFADLAAFSADPQVQETFALSDIPEPMQTWMLNEPYWDEGEWPEELRDYPDLQDFFDLEKGVPQ